MKFKKIFSAIALALLAATSQAQVEVEIIDGTENAALKSRIENYASRFMSEVYNAYTQNRALHLTGLVETNAEMSLEMLWENVHFRSEDQYIGEPLLNSSDGYQMRNIPLEIHPQDGSSTLDYKEAVINFTSDGLISDVYFSIENHTYRKIMEKGIQLNDVEQRLKILDYVEHFRTSYNQKDLNFLNQVFSEDALIVTGKVVKPYKSTDGLTLSKPSVKYSVQKKQEYLAKLKNVFRANSYINVTFDDIIVKRHGVNPNIYGVRVVQHWTSSRYSDEGYLFMVWDFTNPEAPQIHYRIWQPMYLDDKKSIPLPQSEICDLNSIDGI